MKVDKTTGRNKIILSLQIFLLACFYVFTLGVFTFLGSAIYRSIVNNDHPLHAIIMTLVVAFAFLIIGSVMTMVFTVIIKEGQRRKRRDGGSVNGHEI